MKKLVSALLCITLVVAFCTGCTITINVNHDGGAAAPTAAPTAAAPTTAAPTTAAPTAATQTID